MGIRVRALGAVAMAVAIMAAGGCATNCDAARGRFVDPKTLPPPISFQEQVSRLEPNMLKIPRLRATSAAGGVTIGYVDEQGNRKEERADGTLVLRQRFGEEARGGRDPADVRLVGLVFDRKVFEAGRNSTDWWFIMWLNVNQAWVGDARQPVEFGASRGPQGGSMGSAGGGGGGGGRPSVGILRADVVPVLLGVSPWAIRPSPEEAVAMKVDDLLGINNVMTFGPRNDIGGGMGARTSLRREVIVNRITGHIDEVRLYDAGGVMVMRSLLSDYREAQVQGGQEEGAATQQKGPLVPYRVTLEYPAREMTIGLQFDRVVVPARDASYDTPETDQGVTVNRVQ